MDRLTRTRLFGSRLLGAACVSSVLFALSPVSAAASTPCEGATISWDGGAQTPTWTDVLNWDQDRLPSDSDHVCLGSFYVEVPEGSRVTIASLSSSDWISVDGAEIKLTDPDRPSTVNRLDLVASHLELMPGHRLLLSNWTEIDSFSTIAAHAAEIENDGTVMLGEGARIGDRAHGPSSILTNRGSVFATAAPAVIETDITNDGQLVVMDDLSITGRLHNYSPETRTLSGGSLSIHEASLSFPNSGLRVLDGGLQLGPTGTITDGAGSDALEGLEEVGPRGSLWLQQRSLSLTQALTSRGHITVDSSSVLGAPRVEVSSGLLEILQGSRVQAPTVELVGGTLQAAGTVDGDLVNSGGRVQPRVATGLPARLQVTGNYAQGPGGRLNVGLDAQPDLIVGGQALLDGTLVVDSAQTRSYGYEGSFITRNGGEGSFDSVELTGAWRYCTTLEMSYTPALVGGTVRCNVPTDWVSVTIDDDAEFTNDDDVMLRFSIDPDIRIRRFRISNKPDFAGAPWRWDWAYRNPYEWEIASPGQGIRTVYVEFEDARGVISDVASDSIILDWIPPTAMVTKPAGPLGDVLVRFSEIVQGVTPENLVLATAVDDVETTMLCSDSAGGTVDCDTGDVQSVSLRPTAPFVPLVEYSVTVNPGGVNPIVDRAANPARWARHYFTL